MNPDPSSMRAPPPPVEPPTLDALIRQAEQRLLARQHGVAMRYRALAERWQRATAPRRWVW
ncbi:MAG: hypothetical protein KGK09_13370, partial [Burkholderiales bacterium]|nr:hypothetical protein [Burkholderiales bacterium]